MKLAVLSDIHGGYTALQSCVEYARREQVDAFVFLGDYVGELAYPRRAMELLYTLKKQETCYFVRGNKEDYWLGYYEQEKTGEQKQAFPWKEADSTTGMLYYAYHQLAEEDIAFFRELPIARELVFEGLPAMTICHGSPESTRQKLLANDKKTREILEKSPTALILCGHTHVQGKICWGSRRIFNPGSVGMPLESGGRTQFMILHGENGKWQEQFVSLEYDVQRVIAELREEGLFEKAPGWCRVTERVLFTGKKAHGAVLDRAMELCRKDTGVCNWPEIPEKYWKQALEESLE